MADSPPGGLRGCPGDESAAAAAAPSGHFVPPLHAGPVARCCQTARRLSWAPHRRGPKSSSPSAPPLPSSWQPLERLGQDWFSTTRRRTAPASGWRRSRRRFPVRSASRAAALPPPPRHPPARRSSPSRSPAAARRAATSQADIDPRPRLVSPAPIPAAPLTLAAPRCRGGRGASARWLGDPLPAPPPPAPAAPSAQEL